MSSAKTETKTKKESKAGAAVKRARERIAATKAALSSAYDKGYADGYSAAQSLPRKRGVKTMATAGYSAGQKEYARRQKSDARIQRGKSAGTGKKKK